MLFGADKIPELARGLGKGMRQLRDATNEVKKEIHKTAVKNDIDTEIIKDIKKEIHQVKENVEGYTESIKRGTKL